MPSTFEHYKNPTETTHKGRQHCEFSHLLSLSLPKGFLFLPKVWLRLQRVCPNNPSEHLCARKAKSHISAPKQELSLPRLREESVLSWPSINNYDHGDVAKALSLFRASTSWTLKKMKTKSKGRNILTAKHRTYHGVFRFATWSFFFFFSNTTKGISGITEY